LEAEHIVPVAAFGSRFSPQVNGVKRSPKLNLSTRDGWNLHVRRIGHDDLAVGTTLLSHVEVELFDFLNDYFAGLVEECGRSDDGVLTDFFS